MQIIPNASLKTLNTFGLDVKANVLFIIESTDEIKVYVEEHQKENTCLVLGEGSNVLFTKNVEGHVLSLHTNQISIISEDDKSLLVEVEAGMNWHDWVRHCVEKKWGGLENLALIPGKVGAAPIQNIGAYGVEVRDVIESVIYFSTETLQFHSLKNHECAFDYRNSIFKTELKNKGIITSVRFKLKKEGFHQLNVSYKPVSEFLAASNCSTPTIKDVFEAVIHIRKSKLPDPQEIGNAGSFFKNPIVSRSTVESILEKYPTMPFYIVSEEERKIPAAWLIETCGWKGYQRGDAGVHKNQALVLVNYGKAQAEELVELSREIIDSVFNTFSIELSPEVNIY
jgi:UDP-N-acetylmuramate dehydrogenase